jgi:hypothetical protein
LLPKNSLVSQDQAESTNATFEGLSVVTYWLIIIFFVLWVSDYFCICHVF